MLDAVSSAVTPSDEDVEIVGRTARFMRQRFRLTDNAVGGRVRWSLDGSELGIRGIDPEEVLSFFESGAWVRMMPRPQGASVQFGPWTEPSENILPVYSIGEYKGLESDKILLLMQGYAPALRHELLVGISRARCVVAAALDRACVDSLSRAERLQLGVKSLA